MKTRYILFLLLIAGLAIRLYPPITHELNVNFDSIYHARIGQAVAETGWVPEWDYVAGGRPHLYPPLYHLIIGYSSILSGMPATEIVKYILPLVSALIVLPVFFLIRRYRGIKSALLGAAFTAFNPIIMAQSFDSPQLFGLFLFPLVVYAFLEKRYLLGGVFIAISLLFNYTISATILAVLLAVALIKHWGGSREFILRPFIMGAIGAGLASPWLFTAFSRAGECFDPSTAVSALTLSGSSQLLLTALFVAVFGAGLLYLLRKTGDDYLTVWKVALAVGTVGFLLSLLFPSLHPYDQLLLVGFSSIFLLPELKLRKVLSVALIVVLITGSVAVIGFVNPTMSEDDMAAVSWIRDNVDKNGTTTILANPETSGVINTFIGSRSIRTEFDLFLECIPDSRRWSDMYGVLMTRDKPQAEDMLQRYWVDYVVIGARDVSSYEFDIAKFDDMTSLSLVFSEGDARIYQVHRMLS